MFRDGRWQVRKAWCLPRAYIKKNAAQIKAFGPLTLPSRHALDRGRPGRYSVKNTRAQLRTSGDMFARAASCDVTPKDRPVRLAGIAARHAPTSTVRDPIEISALLLECGSKRCLIFSFDLMMVGSELEAKILSRLAALGFGPDEIMLLASHTHNAPATDRACARMGAPDETFVNDAADAAEQLVCRIKREPALKMSLEIFRGRLNHSINRRRFWPFPTYGRTYGFRWRGVVFSPNPSGPKDETVTVILLRRTHDGSPLAAFWHYTCHPTAVVPADVISADYPGAVRLALRERFGEIPCLFAQGFCGNVRPSITPSTQKLSLKARLRRIIYVAASGNLFPNVAAADWARWSQSLAAGVVDIAKGSPVKTLVPQNLAYGSASIPIARFFTGSMPDKNLIAKCLQIGEALEIVILSAEVTVEWQRIFDGIAPRTPGRIRLYAGYQGAVFGYLPTAMQVAEGGYEVKGFQPLFGLAGDFAADRIEPEVVACVKTALDELGRERPRQSKSGICAAMTSEPGRR
jgi:hypothetical protein